MTVASCKATLAESTSSFARAHSPTDERDRLASRNQVVKSTDVGGPASPAVVGTGELEDCCKTDGNNGDIIRVNN
jgi:hypothetical protein